MRLHMCKWKIYQIFQELFSQAFGVEDVNSGMRGEALLRRYVSATVMPTQRQLVTGESA